jgi:hypothetical protein
MGSPLTCLCMFSKHCHYSVHIWYKPTAQREFNARSSLHIIIIIIIIIIILSRVRGSVTRGFWIG